MMLETIIDLSAFVIGALLIMFDIKNQTDIEFTFKSVIAVGLLAAALI